MVDIFNDVRLDGEDGGMDEVDIEVEGIIVVLLLQYANEDEEGDGDACLDAVNDSYVTLFDNDGLR